MSRLLARYVLFYGLTSAIFALSAVAGQRGGNGGEPIEQAFQESAQQGLRVLERRAAQFPEIDLDLLRKTMDRAKVTATDDDLVGNVDGRPKHAINVPEQEQIWVNIPLWSKILDPRRKMALAMHEYFGILGYEVNRYHLTAKIFGMSEEVIAHGRFALLSNGRTFRPFSDSRVRPYWVQIRADVDNLKLVLNNSTGQTLTVLCSSDEAQECELTPASRHALGFFPKPGRSLDMHELKLSVLPDGAFVVVYSGVDYPLGFALGPFQETFVPWTAPQR